MVSTSVETFYNNCKWFVVAQDEQCKNTIYYLGSKIWTQTEHGLSKIEQMVIFLSASVRPVLNFE